MDKEEKKEKVVGLTNKIKKNMNYYSSGCQMKMTSLYTLITFQCN